MNKSLDSLPKPVLSLCMIVKNEIQNLPRCLASVKPYVDEMVVVDTGSQDGTPEIALKSGAKVKNFEWCDDFAAARNYAISQASGDWILMLDADEELVVESEDFWQQLTSRPEILAYSPTYIEVNDQVDITPSYRFSLFRNISELRYVGRYHEMLMYQNQNFPSTQLSHIESLTILHYGFSKSQVLQKNLSRNIPILERIRQSSGLSLKLLYCLAEMYGNTEQQELYEECYAEVFERLLPNLLDGNPPEDFSFVIPMIYSLGVQSLVQKDYETARLLAQRGIEWCSNSPELNYLAGATLRALGFLVGAVAYFEKCIQLGREGSYHTGEPAPYVYMTTYPAYDLGCIYLDLKRPDEALAAFELALSFDPNFTEAQEKIHNIKNGEALMPSGI